MVDDGKIAFTIAVELSYLKEEEHSVRKKISKTELIKKPWLTKKKILEAMELRLDAAIDKTENLEREVEIDRMLREFDSLMEQAHDNKIVAMIAEPVSEYGVEVFEEYKKTYGIREIVPEITYSELKNDGKSR